MSQELVPMGGSLAEIEQLGEMMRKSGFFGDIRDMAQAAVKIMAGRELGIPPVASMMGIHIIKGKIGLGAHLIASLIRQHGYEYRIKRHDDNGCDIEFLSRVENGKRQSLGVSSFGSTDADRAGIKSEMYRKFPRNMYYSRAISNGAKWYCPEVFGGAPIYTTEELGDETSEQPTIDLSGIDTGGAPVGTKEAARNVAERKIEELKAAKQQGNPPDWAVAGFPQDFPSKPGPTVTEIRPAEPVASRPSRPAPWGDNMSLMFKIFGECKDQLGEPRYREILKAHQIKDRSQFKALMNTPIPAAIYWEMQAEIEAKIPVEDPPDSDDPATSKDPHWGVFQEINALATKHKIGPLEASNKLAQLGWNVASQVPRDQLPLVDAAFAEVAKARGGVA